MSAGVLTGKVVDPKKPKTHDRAKRKCKNVTEKMPNTTMPTKVLEYCQGGAKMMPSTTILKDDAKYNDIQNDAKHSDTQMMTWHNYNPIDGLRTLWSAQSK